MRAWASGLAASLGSLSGEELALVLAVGLVLGTSPVYGVPTLLCLAAALALRMNAAALQVVNQLVWPLQVALLVPFARAGWRIHVSPAAPGAWRLCALAFETITGWLFISVPAGILLYLTLLLAMRLVRCSWFQGLMTPAR